MRGPTAFKAAEKLGDFGRWSATRPRSHPIITRGGLLDVAGLCGAPVLPKAEGISAEAPQEVAAAHGTELRRGNTVLIRTGDVGPYPDAERMAEHAGPGINKVPQSGWSSRGTVAVAGDTEALEQGPCAEPENPHAVHSVLLVENGIYTFGDSEHGATGRRQGIRVRDRPR